MNLEELDKEIAFWNETSGTIVANIYALYEHPAYRSLAGHLRTPPAHVEGVTSQLAAPAVAAVGGLLSRALELRHAVARAQELRKSMPLVFQAERIREIHALLSEPSIRLPENLLAPSQRIAIGLTQSATQAFTPRQMLDAMLPEFNAAKAAILAVDDAWSRLPGLLDSAASEASTLQKLDPKSLDSIPIQAKLEAWRGNAMSDPLGVLAALQQELNPFLREIRERIERQMHARKQFDADLAAARETLRRLQEAHAEAVSAHEEALLKADLQSTSGRLAPVEAKLMDDLASWFAKLSEATARGEWQPARVGLAKWTALAAQYSGADRRSVAEAQAVLARRLELRGLLDALKAKAARCHVSEDEELGKLGRQAKELLFTRPTPMLSAEKLVTEYAVRLRTLA